MKQESYLKLVNDSIKEVENEIFLKKSQCEIPGFNLNNEIDNELKKLNKKKYLLCELREFLLEI